MNKVVLVGRLTRDPDIRYSSGENAITIARYNLAVDRVGRRDGSSGEQTADFISIVAFGKNGDFAEKYLHKGQKILVEGHIQTGSYEKDGNKVYTTDVVVERHEFVDSKSDAGQSGGMLQEGTVENGGFVPVGEKEEYPF